MTARIAQFQFSKTPLRALLMALIIAALCATSVAAQADEEHKRVLMLWGDDSFISTQGMLERALRSTLKNGSPVALELYSEYVKNKLSSPGYEKELVALLRRKYEGKKFDLIYCHGDFALGMGLRNRAELFPGTPIVSLSIDKSYVGDLYPAPGLTGVWGEINFKPNLELALALHPGTRRVALIQGVSEGDKFLATKAKEDFREYQSRLEFSDLPGLTIPEMRNALARLPPNTIVFFVSNMRDRVGNTYESPDYLRQVSAASAAPIYGTTEGQMGDGGIVGGRLLSFEALGVEAGRVGLRVIAGEKPEAIAPHVVPSVTMFDWHELRRWGIPENKLPAGSVVRFKELTLWDLYKWYIIALLAAIILEAVLIARLWFTQAKRKQAEKETRRFDELAKSAHHRLAEIVSSVPGMVWESVIDPKTKERKTTFVSDYVRTMLGYTPDEWLAQPPGFGMRIMAEEDRADAAHASDIAISEGKDVVNEHRWRAKDGRIVWAESHLSPVLAYNGHTEGLRGVTLDITERKQAEAAVKTTEEKDRAILEAIPDLMFLQTRDGVYLDLHYSDPANLVVPPKDYLGRNMREILPPDLAAKFGYCFQRTIATGHPQRIEYELTIKEERRWYESRVVCCG